MRLPLDRTRFRDALEKGLGRAILHARRHGLDGMHGEVRRAVLNCLVYDSQCEWHRPAWLWKLMRLGHSEDRHRSAILGRLATVDDYRDAQQLSALAFRFARNGDLPAKKAIYAAFDRFVGVDHHGVEREIMLLDGDMGLRYVADRIGGELEKGGDPWPLRVETIWWYAKDVFGSGAARLALRRGSRRARIFLERALALEDSNRKDRLERRARLKKGGRPRVTWADFRAELEGPKVQSASPNRFAVSATDEELRGALGALKDERRPLQRRKLLQVFARRRPPSWQPFLLEFARSKDDAMQGFAWDTLAHFRRPEVRRLALAAARRRRDVGNGALTLFKNNYLRGDAVLIEAALSGPWKDRDDAHCVVMSIDDIAKGRKHKELAPVYVAAYELTPCALCRRDRVKNLLDLKAAPAWMLEECVEDTDEDARSMARKAEK